MLKNKNIVFIGPGKMAEAMISGILKRQLASQNNIYISGPNMARNNFLNKKYGVSTFNDNAQASALADILILSVKPQRISKVLSEIKQTLQTNTLIISIAAGVSINKIKSISKHNLIVRAMPNTPAKIDKGITVWTACKTVGETEKSMAASILSSFGEEIFMEEEDYLNMATALSGTGPAYVFLFMEAMIDAGVHIGFPRKIAEKLVTHTVIGSAEYYKTFPDIHIAGLRNDVTSPAGTTAASLFELEREGFRTAISKAIWAAYNRSKELGESELK